MTREQIERAARIERENVHKELQENYRRYKDINLYTAFSATIDMYAVPLFKAGAQWRINSVWHEISECKDVKRKILVEYKNGHFDALPDIRDLKGVEDLVARVAYVDDLLPERKEETK